MRSPTLSEEIEDKLARIGGKGVEKARGVHAPSQSDLIEAVDLEVARKINDYENEVLLIGLRKKYGHNIIRFMWVYFTVTMAAIACSSFRLFNIAIDDSTLNAMIGGTAVSVLGVVGTVAAGLFKPPLHKD